MTILQTKEVMQNVEKSHKDTALTTKEVETLFSLWKGTALTMKEVKAQFSLSKDTIMYNFYKYVGYHYKHLLAHKQSQLRPRQICVQLVVPEEPKHFH